MSLDRYRRPRMIVLPPNATAHEAARAMADHGICAVLIADAGALVGILTDRDLVIDLVAAALDPCSTAVADIMSRDVAVLDVGASLADAVRIMRERACRRIPLIEDGRPVGLVTLDDLMVDGEISQGTRLIVAAQLDAEAQRARVAAGAARPGRAEPPGEEILQRGRPSGLRAATGEPARGTRYRRSA